MSQIDPALVERFTGQRRVLSLEVAEAQLRDVSAAYSRINVAHVKLRARLRRDSLLLRWARFRLGVARLPVLLKTEGWILLLSLSVICAITAASVVITALPPHNLMLILAAVCPFLLMGLTPFAFPADTSALERAQHVIEENMLAARRDLRISDPMMSSCKSRLEAARQLLHGLLLARDYPLNRLLNANISAMPGAEFELYLAEVFSFLGYLVRTTGRAGDQGVDLVVSRNGVSIAVQAKCYSGSVGNSAVQQVYTGMRMYQCQKCAVVAASFFTRGAHEAAQAVGCILISRHHIPDLIRGNLMI